MRGQDLSGFAEKREGGKRGDETPSPNPKNGKVSLFSSEEKKKKKKGNAPGQKKESRKEGGGGGRKVARLSNPRGKGKRKTPRGFPFLKPERGLFSAGKRGEKGGWGRSGRRKKKKKKNDKPTFLRGGKKKGGKSKFPRYMGGGEGEIKSQS